MCIVIFFIIILLAIVHWDISHNSFGRRIPTSRFYSFQHLHMRQQTDAKLKWQKLLKWPPSHLHYKTPLHRLKLT